ncbi:polysaccharide deacetylase family protein [Christiangramia salexigens]|nr:polysaccharide deacetylase family protein [Christiangramia salexigens]
MKVLVYHKIASKKQFEKQIHYLKNNYEIINPLLLEDYINNRIPLPENALMITFDDGDFSIYRNAYPILKAEKIPAIIFVITGLIGTNRPFWWDEIEYFIEGKEGRAKVWEVKKWSNTNREIFLKRLRKESNKQELEYRQLSLTELREMHDSGIVIANHSHTHPMFDQCSLEELENEIKISSNKLKKLNFISDAFAYPNGNFSRKSERTLKEAGMKLVFLFDHKINRGTINPFRISRLVVNDTTPIWKFKFILSGIHSRILPITKLIGKIYRKIKK